MIKKYADFINNHHTSLVYQINTELDIQMEELRKEFIRQINYYLTPDMPVHYEEDHTYDPPYDCSGELVKAGALIAAEIDRIIEQENFESWEKEKEGVNNIITEVKNE